MLVIVYHALALAGKAGRITAMRGGEGCQHFTNYISDGRFDSPVPFIKSD